MANLPSLPDYQLVLAVALGGAVGSVARFLTGYFMSAAFGSTFPWATLAVNVFGSSWLGLIGTLAVEKPGTIDPALRLLLTTGFAGGLTTFSTLTYESLELYQRGDTGLAFGNLALNFFVGMLAAWVGAIIARVI